MRRIARWTTAILLGLLPAPALLAGCGDDSVPARSGDPDELPTEPVTDTGVETTDPEADAEVDTDAGDTGTDSGAGVESTDES